MSSRKQSNAAKKNRLVEKTRETHETQVSLKLDLDGDGAGKSLRLMLSLPIC